MARRTTIKVDADIDEEALVFWVNNIKNTLSEDLAYEMVYDLKRLGPYWLGQFEGAWVVALGTLSIPATEEPIPEDDTERIMMGPLPRPSVPSPTIIPKAKGRKSINYTIGNKTTYREIAMDLVPDPLGGYRKDRNNITADPDWYVNYLQGSGVIKMVERTTKRTANRTEIKNYKGKL